MSPLNPGYYFVSEASLTSFLQEIGYHETYLVEFLRDIIKETLPRDSKTIVVRGLGVAIVSTPAEKLALFLHSKLSGKANLILRRRLAVIFPVERASKNLYHYLREGTKKLRLEDIFGTLVEKINDDILFCRPI